MLQLVWFVFGPGFTFQIGYLDSFGKFFPDVILALECLYDDVVQAKLIKKSFLAIWEEGCWPGQDLEGFACCLCGPVPVEE